MSAIELQRATTTQSPGLGSGDTNGCIDCFTNSIDFGTHAEGFVTAMINDASLTQVNGVQPVNSFDDLCQLLVSSLNNPNQPDEFDIVTNAITNALSRSFTFHCRDN